MQTLCKNSLVLPRKISDGHREEEEAQVAGSGNGEAAKLVVREMRSPVGDISCLGHVLFGIPFLLLTLFRFASSSH